MGGRVLEVVEFEKDMGVLLHKMGISYRDRDTFIIHGAVHYLCQASP